MSTHSEISTFERFAIVIFCIATVPFFFGEHWFKEHYPLLLLASAVTVYGSLFIFCLWGSYKFGKVALSPLKWTSNQYAKKPMQRIMRLFHYPKELYLSLVLLWVGCASLFSLIKSLINII